MTSVVAEAGTKTRSRSVARSIVPGSLTMFGGQIAIKIISFVFSVVVIRYIGSEEYGKFAVCVAFGSLFAVLSDLGLATLMVKRIALDRSLMPALASNVLVLRLLLSLFVVGLTSLVAWLVGYSGEIRLGILIAALGLLSYSFFGVVDALAMGQERFRFSAVFNVAAQLATLALAAALVFSGGGFLGLLGATTVSVLGVSLFAMRRLHRESPLRADVRPATWLGLTRAAWPFAAIGLALALSYRADAVILSMFVPISTIGAYAVAYNLIFAFSTLSHSINLVLFPTMTRLHAESPDESPELFRQGFRYLFFVSLPVAAFVSLNATDIVTFVYGNALANAGRPLAILIWVLPLMFLSEFLGYVAIVLNNERLVARANWVSSGANVAGNLAFIPLYGIVAAAIATVVTELLLVGQFLHALRHTGMLAHGWRIFGATIVSVTILIVAIVLLRRTDLPLVVLGSVSILVYFLAAFVVGAFGKDEYRMLTALSQRHTGI